MRAFSVTAITCVTSWIVAAAPVQATIMLPELIYYKFDEGSGNSTANSAVPGVGSNPATVTGHTLDAPGVFGSTALRGASTGHVTTGWATSLGSGGWTIAFWLSPIDSADNSLSYMFEDPSTGAGFLRAFNGGLAGPTGMALRGPVNDVVISGLSDSANNHIAYVYDSAAGNIKGYLNGMLNNTVSQSGLNINGTGLLVGNSFVGSGFGLRSGQWMDEFQVYSRALSGPDVMDAMNANFGVVPEPATFAVWSILGMCGIGYHWRRKRKTA